MRNNFSSNSDRVMHKAVCSECGKECEIPFKPMNDKPIYCSDCFGKNNKGKNNSDSTKEFDNLNAKLDLIIKFFKISEIKEKSSNVKVKEESDKIEVKEEEVVKSKKKAPKKTEETKEIKIKKVVKNKKA
jgi:CxxC-x17-CxxC domain-containing protein